VCLHGRPQDFFQGRAKFSRGGGAKTYYLPKKRLRTYYFHSKKLKNTLFWPAKGRGASAPSCPPLQTPMCVCEGERERKKDGGEGERTKKRGSVR